MNIQLKEWKVKSLSLNINEPPTDQRPEIDSFELSIGHSFSKDDLKKFVLGFNITINAEKFNVSMEILFVFEIDEEINEDFRKSDFLKINVPAIAFPYVRSYISNLTLQSGFSPIILPSINFVKLAKEGQTQEF